MKAVSRSRIAVFRSSPRRSTKPGPARSGGEPCAGRPGGSAPTRGARLPCSRRTRPEVAEEEAGPLVKHGGGIVVAPFQMREPEVVERHGLGPLITGSARRPQCQLVGLDPGFPGLGQEQEAAKRVGQPPAVVVQAYSRAARQMATRLSCSAAIQPRPRHSRAHHGAVRIPGHGFEAVAVRRDEPVGRLQGPQVMTRLPAQSSVPFGPRQCGLSASAREEPQQVVELEPARPVPRQQVRAEQPVQPLTSLVPPGPHQRRGGFQVEIRTRVEPQQQVSPAQFRCQRADRGVEDRGQVPFPVIEIGQAVPVPVCVGRLGVQAGAKPGRCDPQCQRQPRASPRDPIENGAGRSPPALCPSSPACEAERRLHGAAAARGRTRRASSNAPSSLRLVTSTRQPLVPGRSGRTCAASRALSRISRRDLPTRSRKRADRSSACGGIISPGTPS